MEKVIVAFESEKACERICDILESGGVAACYRAHSGGEVKRLVAKQHIGTVVCGYKLRDETAEDLFYDLPAASTMLVIGDQILVRKKGMERLDKRGESFPGQHDFRYTG